MYLQVHTISICMLSRQNISLNCEHNQNTSIHIYIYFNKRKLKCICTLDFYGDFKRTLPQGHDFKFGYE